MEDLSGKQLGPYRIVERLGEGGMSAVYTAYQPGVDRHVAVKVLPRHLLEDETFAGRFRQEAQVVARLQHPHILPIFDFGDSDDHLYFVMPLVKTGTLADRLQRGSIPLEEAGRIIPQLADALDYAHEQGLVHRDIKPGNVLLDGRGNVMLTDFGIARLQEATSHFTRTGGIVGTPAYMSPEQSEGEALDRRTDVYSLGILLYQMVTGRVPFEADTPISVLLKHLQEPPPPPRTLNPALPPAVEDVILQALAKRPEDRFATAGRLAQALDAAISGVRPASGQKPASQEETWVESLPSTLPRPRSSPSVRFLVAGAALLLLLIAGGAWLAFGSGLAPGNETEGPTIPASGTGDALAAAGQAAPATPTSPDATQDRLLAAQPSTNLATSTATGTVASAAGEAVGSPTPTPTATATATTAPTDWRQGKLAFLVLNNGPREVYTMDLAAGGEPQLAYRPPGGALLGPLWSPDGGEVVVYQLDGQVIFLDPATGNVRRAAHNCTAPAWSPGGDRLICRSSDGDTFDLIDAETGALRGSVPRPATALLPQWSPVSDEIVYATLDGDATAIWRRSLEGGLPVELAADSLENYAPAWSPDGQWIAYQSRLNSANSEIWVMDRNGENARRLTNSPAASWSRAPYWSPDGRWLAFVSNREGGVVAEYGDVFVVSMETGEVQQVTRTGGRVYNWRVSWSR